jgi:hypothetical protein
MKTFKLAVFVSAALLSSSALAAVNATDIVTGGVGMTNRAEIESIQNQYSLKLVYTGVGGMYLSDVDVTVTDKSGQIVASQKTDGPIMLIKLPAGSYTVSSSYAGHQKTNKISVGSQLRTVQVGFPVTDADIAKVSGGVIDRGGAAQSMPSASPQNTPSYVPPATSFPTQNAPSPAAPVMGTPQSGYQPTIPYNYEGGEAAAMPGSPTPYAGTGYLAPKPGMPVTGVTNPATVNPGTLEPAAGNVAPASPAYGTEAMPWRGQTAAPQAAPAAAPTAAPYQGAPQY